MDDVATCAVNIGTVSYVTLPVGTLLDAISGSSDNANRIMALGINGADFHTVFVDTTTDTEIVDNNEGVNPYANVIAYAAVNQTFWVVFLNGAVSNSIQKYSKDGAFLGSTILIAANTSTNTGNVSSYISYEPTTQLIYTFPDSDGFGGNDDMLLIFNPSTNAITTQTLEVFSGVVSGGPVLSCPGKIFVNGLNSMAGQTLFNIYNVPGFALVGTIDLSVSGWQGGFAYAANTGKVYFASASAPQIFEINPNNAVTDFTYNLGTSEVNSLVYDPIQGRLIAFDIAGNVITIDPVGRTVVCVEASSGLVLSYQGAAIDPNLGKAYGNPLGALATTEIWQ